ncbi:hypothetical protein [Tsukamurella soli]|uniref:Uncharacterized protein n=1 Tax=Tsukamurella soli TaxID=644556 RepID=A0ABP8K0K7_9ACTN
MEPIGLNVGGYYLTAIEPDRWLADESYSWAVREATTGDSIGTVTLTPDGAVTSTPATAGPEPHSPQSHSPDSKGLAAAVAAVHRFAAAR